MFPRVLYATILHSHDRLQDKLHQNPDGGHTCITQQTCKDDSAFNILQKVVAASSQHQELSGVVNSLED